MNSEFVKSSKKIHTNVCVCVCVCVFSHEVVSNSLYIVRHTY